MQKGIFHREFQPATHFLLRCQTNQIFGLPQLLRGRLQVEVYRCDPSLRFFLGGGWLLPVQPLHSSVGESLRIVSSLRPSICSVHHQRYYFTSFPSFIPRKEFCIIMGTTLHRIIHAFPHHLLSFSGEPLPTLSIPGSSSASLSSSLGEPLHHVSLLYA